MLASDKCYEKKNRGRKEESGVEREYFTNLNDIALVDHLVKPQLGTRKVPESWNFMDNPNEKGVWENSAESG